VDFQNQIELELYFADHFDTILYPVLADLYFQQGDLRRARKVCEIGLKHHENDSIGLYMLAQIDKSEGNLKQAEKNLERVLLYTYEHLAAAEMLCEIQTVLGRAQNRLLKSWKHVLELDPRHKIAQEFINKVDKKENKASKKEISSKIGSKKQKINNIVNKTKKETIKVASIPSADDIGEPLKVSSRLATFTLVSVLKNQGLFSQALEVLDALEEKGEDLESISLERDTIKTLIEKSQKD